MVLATRVGLNKATGAVSPPNIAHSFITSEGAKEMD